MVCLCVAGGLVLIWVLVVWLDPVLSGDRAFRAKLAARESLSDAQMLARYFADADIPPDVPAAVRRVLAHKLAWPTQRLRPDDDVSFLWRRDEFFAFDLFEEIGEAFGIRISADEALRTPMTIRAVSLLVARKARRQRRGP